MEKQNKGYCITIEHKDGKRALVPLTTWENGLKLDPDWHVFVSPVFAAPVAPLEVVELKKPYPLLNSHPLPIPNEIIAKKTVKRKGK